MKSIRSDIYECLKHSQNQFGKESEPEAKSKVESKIEEEVEYECAAKVDCEFEIETE
jgi:hypothetical protein